MASSRAIAYSVVVGLLVAVVVAAVIAGPDDVPAATVIIPLFVAAAFLSAMETAAIGVVAITVGTILVRYSNHLTGHALASRIVLIVASAVGAVGLAAVRERREKTLEEQRFLGGLQSLTASLLRAATVDDLAAVACAQCAALLGADVARLSLLDERQWLRIVAEVGSPDSWRSRRVAVSIDERSASTDAIRANAPLFFSTSEEYTTRYENWAPSFEGMRIASMAVVPVCADGAPAGALVLMYSTPNRFDEQQRALIRDVADQIGGAVERTRLREFERNVVTTLQNTLLGPPLLVAGIGHAVRYLPADTDLAVGGDWYDAQRRPDGRISVGVGDAVGRGLRAAAVMGQLRSALAGCALDAATPAEALDRLDVFARRIPDATGTTALIAILDVAGGRLDYASAGHLPAVCVLPSGETRLLDDAQNLPLATFDGPPRRGGSVEFPPGALVFFYTDGLVERRGEPLDVGFARLVDALAPVAVLPLELICDRVLESMVGGLPRGDDLALLALRSPVVSETLFLRKVPAHPSELHTLRAALRTWLQQTHLTEDAQGAVLLAVGEACANVIEHAYPDNDGLLRVEASNLDDAVVCAVSDTGRWRDDNDAFVGGNGIPIMRALMHDVRVDRRATGTSVTMWYRKGAVAGRVNGTNERPAVLPSR